MADWFQDEECRREDESRMTNKTTSAIDLVERLRREEMRQNVRAGAYHLMLVNPDGPEAADTITRLQAALEQAHELAADVLALVTEENKQVGGSFSNRDNADIAFANFISKWTPERVAHLSSVGGE